jgi:hypothetical protein
MKRKGQPQKRDSEGFLPEARMPVRDQNLAEDLANKIEPMLLEAKNDNVVFDALAMVLRSLVDKEVAGRDLPDGFQPYLQQKILKIADDLSDLIQER